MPAPPALPPHPESDAFYNAIIDANTSMEPALSPIDCVFHSYSLQMRLITSIDLMQRRAKTADSSRFQILHKTLMSHIAPIGT